MLDFFVGISIGFLLGIVFKSFFKLRSKRKSLKIVSYDSANEYLERGWTIASEEDTNQKIGWIWLEKLEEEK